MMDIKVFEARKFLLTYVGCKELSYLFLLHQHYNRPLLKYFHTFCCINLFKVNRNILLALALVNQIYT